jgi:hypothetical protein
MICSAWRWGIHLRRMGERTSLALGACTQVGKVFDYKVILVVPAPRVRPSAGPRTGSTQRRAGTQSLGGILGSRFRGNDDQDPGTEMCACGFGGTTIKVRETKCVHAVLLAQGPRKRGLNLNRYSPAPPFRPACKSGPRRPFRPALRLLEGDGRGAGKAGNLCPACRTDWISASAADHRHVARC